MVRRRPLVTQHLENISREALEKYQDIIKEYIRKRQGIYALYRRGKLYYVGLASNLRARLKTHLRDRHGELWDRFSVYLTIGDEHMRELEAMILRIVNPAGNKVKGKFIKSENLRNRVRRDFRLRLREEEAQLWGGRGYQPKKKRKTKKEELKKSKATGRRPILAKYGKTGMRLKGVHKGKNLKAWVRKDGAIRYDGDVYNSPSLAARAAIGHKANGWRFWKYERSPGDWVSLDHLRR
jgi:predicted GIY-YIG superfamily endonuclease